MKHLSYIHFNFNKRHCTYADPRFIVKRLRCHLFLTNSDGYQLRWLPTELVINQFHNELITQHKILCIESIIFDSNKVSVINSFGDIEIGELHRRRKMFSAKLESANFVVGEKKIRRKCTNSNYLTSTSTFQLFNHSTIPLFNNSAIQLQLFNDSTIPLLNYSTIQLQVFNY